MSQRILPLDLTRLHIIVRDEQLAEPPRIQIPTGVQTGVRQDRGVRFREVRPGLWSYEIRRKHGTTFGGPFQGLPAAMERAARVQLALVEKKIAA